MKYLGMEISGADMSVWLRAIRYNAEHGSTFPGRDSDGMLCPYLSERSIADATLDSITTRKRKGATLNWKRAVDAFWWDHATEEEQRTRMGCEEIDQAMLENAR